MLTETKIKKLPVPDKYPKTYADGRDGLYIKVSTTGRKTWIYRSRKGGESIILDFALGTTQSIGVDDTVEHPTEAGVRFRAEEDRITVSELSPSANFTYYAEYLIDFVTNPSGIVQISGSGWFKQGYALRASAPSEFSVSRQTRP